MGPQWWSVTLCWLVRPALLFSSKPKPAWRTFSSLTKFLDSLSDQPFLLSSCSYCCHQPTDGLRTEPSNAYVNGEQPGTPPSLSAKVQKLGVLCFLSLIGLFTPCLPWYCELDDGELLPCLGPQNNIGSQGSLDNVWENKSPPEVNFHVPSGSAII